MQARLALPSCSLLEKIEFHVCFRRIPLSFVFFFFFLEFLGLKRAALLVSDSYTHSEAMPLLFQHFSY